MNKKTIVLEKDMDFYVNNYDVREDIHITIEENGSIHTFGNVSGVIKDENSESHIVAHGNGNAENHGKGISIVKGSGFAHALQGSAFSLGGKKSHALSCGDEYNFAFAAYGGRAYVSRHVWEKTYHGSRLEKNPAALAVSFGGGVYIDGGGFGCDLKGKSINILGFGVDFPFNDENSFYSEEHLINVHRLYSQYDRPMLRFVNMNRNDSRFVIKNNDSTKEIKDNLFGELSVIISRVHGKCSYSNDGILRNEMLSDLSIVKEFSKVLIPLEQQVNNMFLK